MRNMDIFVGTCNGIKQQPARMQDLEYGNRVYFNKVQV